MNANISKVLAGKIQSTADMIFLLAIRSDTTFSLDIYYFSPLILVKFFS